MSANIFSPPIVSFTDTASTISELHQAHAYMLKTGLFHHPFAASRLLTTATTISPTLHYPHSIFTNIHQPNTYIYNTMIRAYSITPTPHVSLIIFLKLLNDHCVSPDKYTFTFILKACATLCSTKQGQQIHGLLIRSGFSYDTYIFNTLIHMYAKCGCFETARAMLERLPVQDCIPWNSVLSVYIDMGLLELARDLFDEMPVKNQESWNFMLSGYGNCGLVDEARILFDEMLIKDVVSWNAMISCYCRAGMYNEVLKFFEEMLKEAKVKPDNYTFVNVLSACAGVGALSQGKWVHAYIDRNDVEINGFLATAMVDMYFKSGSVEKAIEVFDNTLKKDISTWNSMISGLSIHGFGNHALKIFNQMVGDGFKPNEVTFISVLSACSRAGLLSEGREMFNHMVNVYGVQPCIEHYGCMVELLGRFGLFEEAEELVIDFPEKEARILWELILSACRNHGETELAERIAKKVLELDPQNSAGYVQLSNIHASMGKWSDVMEVRRKMREKGVLKDPGCSMIEINGIVHEFLAGEGMIC